MLEFLMNLWLLNWLAQKNNLLCVCSDEKRREGSGAAKVKQRCFSCSEIISPFIQILLIIAITKLSGIIVL